MSEGQYFAFGGFAAEIDTSWDRLVYETRNQPEILENLERYCNGEQVCGDKDQTDFCYR